MKTFNITIVYTNGLSSHITNRKAESKKEAFTNEVNSLFNETEDILSITVIEAKKSKFE